MYKKWWKLEVYIYKFGQLKDDNVFSLNDMNDFFQDQFIKISEW